MEVRATFTADIPVDKKYEEMLDTEISVERFDKLSDELFEEIKSKVKLDDCIISAIYINGDLFFER